MKTYVEFCETCIKAKATHKPFPKETKTEYKTYGDKVVSNVWGPAPVKPLGGKQYYLLFKDLFSHEEHIYFLKHKSEVLNHYKKFDAWVKVQRNRRITILASDRGGEFTSKAFNEYLKNAGTIQHLTVHDSPASNGVAACANCTLLDGTRAMLKASKLSSNLWAEAINHHIWIRNRVPTRSLKVDKMLLELATGQKPNFSGVYLWGCKAWVKILDVGKLEPRAKECRCVGFNRKSKGFRVYWPGKKCLSIKRDIYFNKRELLADDEVHIEGKTTIPTNLNYHQSLSQLTTPSINDKMPENMSNNIKIPNKSNNKSVLPQQTKPVR